MKQICFSVILLAFAISCYGQNILLHKNTAIPSGDAGTPKTVNEADNTVNPSNDAGNLSIANRTGNTARPSNDAGSPKIVNWFGNTGRPYLHFISKGFQDKAGNIWFATSEGIYRYDGASFTNYKYIDGLSIVLNPGTIESVVKDIVEDKAGNIWFCTHRGIIRYDKKTFTQVEIPADNILSQLTSIESGKGKDPFNNGKPGVAIFADRSGNMWLFSGFNVYRFNEISGAVEKTGIGDYLKSMVLPPNSINKNGSLEGVFEDKKGNIWFTTKGTGPLSESYRLGSGGVSNPCILNSCKHDIHNADDMALHNKEIGASFTKVTLRYTHNSFAYTSAIEDKDGNIWFGTLHNGVYRCDGNGYIDQFTNADALSKSSVSTIYEDRTGKIWFGTITNDSSFRGHGVFRYDPSTSKTSALSLAHFTAKDGLCSKGTFSNSSVTCITEDNNGRIWFGGDGGVSYYNGKGFTSFIEKDGMGNYPVKCFVTDRSGFLWLGTWDLGLYRYDGKSFTCFTENASKS